MVPLSLKTDGSALAITGITSTLAMYIAGGMARWRSRLRWRPIRRRYCSERSVSHSNNRRCRVGMLQIPKLTSESITFPSLRPSPVLDPVGMVDFRPFRGCQARFSKPSVSGCPRLLVRFRRPLVRNDVCPGRSRLEEVHQNFAWNQDSTLEIDTFGQLQPSSCVFPIPILLSHQASPSAFAEIGGADVRPVRSCGSGSRVQSKQELRMEELASIV